MYHQQENNKRMRQHYLISFKKSDIRFIFDIYIEVNERKQQNKRRKNYYENEEPQVDTYKCLA